MGYVYALLAMISYSIVGASYKLSDHWKCNGHQANFCMFFTGAVLAMSWAIVAIRLQPVVPAIGVGAAIGIVLIIAVAAFRIAVSKGRVSTSWTVINLGLVLPVLAAIFIWQEIPSPKHCVGVSLTVVAVILLGLDIGRAGE